MAHSVLPASFLLGSGWVSGVHLNKFVPCAWFRDEGSTVIMAHSVGTGKHRDSQPLRVSRCSLFAWYRHHGAMLTGLALLNRHYDDGVGIAESTRYRHHGALRLAGARRGAHKHVVARLVRRFEHHALHPVQRRQPLLCECESVRV